MQKLWVCEQEMPTIVCGLGAQLILDTNVTLPSYDGGLRLVMSLKQTIYDTPSTTQHQREHVVIASMHNMKTFVSIN